MVDRVKFLVQKRTSLKSEITNLSNLLDKDKISSVVLRLRGACLTKLYHAYEEYNDELAVLDPSDAHIDEFANIQERFYVLAGRIENILNATDASSAGASVSNDQARSVDNGRVVERKRIKLLERSYEEKRILISRHLSLILNLPALEEETMYGLSKLADDALYHIASLSALGVSVTPEIVVHLLENKLPETTLEKWEATLKGDEFPKLDQMYDFLYTAAAVCALRRENVKATETEKCKGELSVKRKRFQSKNKSFVLNVGRNCVVCRIKRHPLYLCDEFKQLPIPKRIETVKNAKLCYNCMRSHRGSCKFSSCSICQKRHNTLLHDERFASKSNIKTDTV